MHGFIIGLAVRGCESWSGIVEALVNWIGAAPLDLFFLDAFHPQGGGLHRAGIDSQSYIGPPNQYGARQSM